MTRRARPNRRRRGFTLVELVIGITLTALLAVAFARLITASVRASTGYEDELARSEEGILAMERIRAQLERAPAVMIPNAHDPTRGILAFARDANADGDSYFGDGSFPRSAEDVPGDMTADDKPGIEGVDDDGSGNTDENHFWPPSWSRLDDDEDGSLDEDPIDGVDNDGDGNIDEDPPSDNNDDGQPGLASFDDDADGGTDEGGSDADNDEDGTDNEDPIGPMIIRLDGGTHLLEAWSSNTVKLGTLCSHVSSFSTLYSWDENPENAPVVTISLTVQCDGGGTQTYTESVYLRNAQQFCGKRVR
jgi:prepilin-type N-terminal cleavage/methylation domain-containing protein